MEQQAFDLLAFYLNTTTIYEKNIEPLACKTNGTYTGIWKKLYSHSCEMVMGTWPCSKDALDFDVANTQFSDDVVLIVPRVPCVRHVGFLKISFILLPVIALGFLSVKIYSMVLFSWQRRQFSKSSHITQALLALLLGFSILVSAGYFQGKIFDSLVETQDHCGATSLEEVVSNGEKIGLESPLLYEVLNEISKEEKLIKLKQFTYINKDPGSLDTTHSHILREFMYNYLLPRKYVLSNREPVFKKVQKITRINLGLYFHKRSFLKINVSTALLRFNQGNINMKIINQVTEKALKLEQIANKQLQTHSPVLLKEICWLFEVFGVFHFVSFVVFLLEIIVYKSVKKN